MMCDVPGGGCVEERLADRRTPRQASRSESNVVKCCEELITHWVLIQWCVVVWCVQSTSTSKDVQLKRSTEAILKLKQQLLEAQQQSQVLVLQ